MWTESGPNHTDENSSDEAWIPDSPDRGSKGGYGGKIDYEFKGGKSGYGGKNDYEFKGGKGSYGGKNKYEFKGGNGGYGGKNNDEFKGGKTPWISVDRGFQRGFGGKNDYEFKGGKGGKGGDPFFANTRPRKEFPRRKGNKGGKHGQGFYRRPIETKPMEGAERRMAMFMRQNPDFVFQPRPGVPTELQAVYDTLGERGPHLYKSLRHHLQGPEMSRGRCAHAAGVAVHGREERVESRPTEREGARTSSETSVQSASR